MKKLLALFVLGLFSLALVSPIGSATDTGNITVQAVVQSGTPDATFKIYKAPNGGNVDYATPYTSMNFNRFTVVQQTGKPAQWTGADHFVVVAWTNGLGDQYKIQGAGLGTFTLSAGTATLPAGSFGCIPVYSATDMWDTNNDGTPDTPQGSMPLGALLANPFKAITGALTTWADVYTSENPGSNRIIQVRYAFPPYTTSGGDPYTSYEPIPTSQTSGTYTGVTVKVRITPV